MEKFNKTIQNQNSNGSESNLSQQFQVVGQNNSQNRTPLRNRNKFISTTSQSSNQQDLNQSQISDKKFNNSSSGSQPNIIQSNNNLNGLQIIDEQLVQPNANEAYLLTRTTSELVLHCNKSAMENLRMLNFNTSLDLLKKSEQLLISANVPKDIIENEKSKLLALTYNNLGCLFKKKMQANIALTYLQKALDLEIQSNQDQMNIAGTMLNICAILSQLKKHKKAIVYAQNCLQKSEQVLAKLKIMPNFTQADSGSDTSEQLQRDSYIKNVYTTMTIALYNLGVEHEYLNEYSQALENFNRAMYITQEVLDKDPQMTKVINEGLQSVLVKQQKKFIIANIYGGKNSNNSPERLMIDMNSSRFAPIDSKRSAGLSESTQRFMNKRGENLTNISLNSGNIMHEFLKLNFYRRINQNRKQILKLKMKVQQS